MKVKERGIICLLLFTTVDFNYQTDRFMHCTVYRCLATKHL